MIFIPTANSNVGAAAAAWMHTQSKVPVRLGARNTAAARARFPAAEVVPFDYAQPDRAAASLQGVQAVLLTVPTDGFPIQPMLDFIAAAEAARVQHLVLLSAYGVDFRPHPMQALEARVQASPCTWTILRPNTFMQNYLGMLGESVRRNSAVAEPAAEGRVGMIDARDSGAVAAVCLAQPAAHAGQTYVLTGPAALTRAEVAATFRQALGRPVRYDDLPPAVFADLLTGASVPPPFVQMLGGFYDDIRSGRMDVLTDAVARITGQAPRSFAQFVADHRHAWQAAVPA